MARQGLRVREVIHNFNADGFDALYPKYAGGRPPTFSLPQRRKIKKVALSRPGDHGLPFSTWSLYPPEALIAIVMDNYSPHLSTKKDTRVGEWAEANNLEFGLRADQCQLPQPDRVSLYRSALLRA